MHKKGLYPITLQAHPASTLSYVSDPMRMQNIFEKLSIKLSDGNVPRYVMYKKFDADNDGKCLK